MTRSLIALGVSGGLLIVLVLLFLLTNDRRTPERPIGPTVATMPAMPRETPPPASEAHHGFLYGRVTTEEGATHEGRLRFGGDEEAFWGDGFNSPKEGNPWATHVPPDQLMERSSIQVFGAEVDLGERRINLARPFMARFGDIARIEVEGTEIRVTLKSGTVFGLDRMGADDLGDGLRVWDVRDGVVDLAEGQIRVVELLPTARLVDTPDRLYGTVRTQQGDFSGFVQWDWAKSVGTDELRGFVAGEERALRFDAIQSIARDGDESALVTLHDESEIVLSGTRDVGKGNRGIYVDDPRYGRVLISWDSFERVDFSPGGSGPAFDDFPVGRPLAGSVTTHEGRLLAGMLVYDLDESETTETFDAPAQGVDYTIPFGLIASIALPGREASEDLPALVTLHSGEELRLERSGDLGEGNAGMLVFTAGRKPPEYVRWTDVERIDLDRPLEMYPPIDGR